MDFNTDRFLTFGRYDLTINKAFYRTMVLITVFGATGFAFVSFFLRWWMYKASAMTYYDENGAMSTIPVDEGSPMHYHYIGFTVVFLILFLSIMHIIFAGCTFHNLRNKQGRISELTLPATNLEKYLWHLSVSLIGGFVVIFAATLCADALNAILNLIFMPSDAHTSLTLQVAKIVTLYEPDTNSRIILSPFSDMEINEFLKIFRFLMISLQLNNTAVFILGNSIKYKYNIILTYIIDQIIAWIVVILFFVLVIKLGKENDTHVSHEEALAFIKAFLNILAVTLLAFATLFIWKSYSLYKKAQITSSLNK